MLFQVAFHLQSFRIQKNYKNPRTFCLHRRFPHVKHLISLQTNKYGLIHPMAYGPEKRYSKALFELASDEKQLSTLVEEADTLIKALQEEEFSIFLTSPELSPKQKSAVLASLMKTAKASDTMRKFVSLMAQKGRADVIVASLQCFKNLYLDSEHVARAKVVSAFPLAEKQKQDVEAFVKKQVKGSKRVELEEQVDEGLIGGFKVLVGSEQFDASLNGRLNQIKTLLRG